MPTPLAPIAPADVRVLARRTWWVFLVGGIASIVFGVLAFAQPAAALFVLALLFAAHVLVDGVSSVIGALRHREKDGWWVLLLLGLVSTVAGAYLLASPPLSVLAFVYVVALQALAAGVFLVVFGWKIRQRTTREWILYATGGLSFLVGLSMIATPLAGSISLVFVLATWAIVGGLMRVIFAVRVRRLPVVP